MTPRKMAAAVALACALAMAVGQAHGMIGKPKTGSGEWGSNAYAEWSKLALDDKDFMRKQEQLVRRTIAEKAPEMFKEVILAIAMVESSLHQFDKDGNPTRSKVRGGHTWGVMRISDQPWARYPFIDYERIKWDARYNIESGILIFLDKWIRAGQMKDKYPGLAKVSRIQLAIQLYYGLVPLQPGVDRWWYSRLVIRTTRRNAP